MALENVDAYVATIDENGNIEIKISKHNEDILQAFRIRENRKGISILQCCTIPQLRPELLIGRILVSRIPDIFLKSPNISGLDKKCFRNFDKSLICLCKQTACDIILP